MSGYRDDDQTVGYCPKCWYPLSALTTADKGYCQHHGWRFAEWSRQSVEAWAEAHGEDEYLRMEAKLDRKDGTA